MNTHLLDIHDLYKSRQMFIKEGQKRNFSFERLGKFTFRAEKNNEGFVFHSLPFNLTTRLLYPHVEEKECEKEMMSKVKMCTPRTFFTIAKKVKTYTTPNDIAYPVVAKPMDGFLGESVYLNISHEKELKEKIRSVQESGYDCLVEEMIKADAMKEYRIIVLDGKVVACVERRPASIIGNGKNSIRTLVSIRNKEPYRGPRDSHIHTLHYLPPEEEYSPFIAKIDLTPRSIPPAGQRIYLDHRITSIFGADLIDQTNEIHSTFVNLCEQFVQKYKFFIIGFDVIAGNISHPTTDQTYFFNEFNVRPFYDINECVNYGQGIPISSLMWDAIDKNRSVIINKEFLPF